MKIKSISGITCYVKDLKKTEQFYKQLGFTFKKKDSTHIVAYVNWFWIDFILVTKKSLRPKNEGVGLFVGLNVDDVDKFYKLVVSKKLKTINKPIDLPNGTREFLMRDPDGYKLAVFSKQ